VVLSNHSRKSFQKGHEANNSNQKPDWDIRAINKIGNEASENGAMTANNNIMHHQQRRIVQGAKGLKK